MLKKVTSAVMVFLFASSSVFSLNMPASKIMNASVTPTGGVQTWDAVLKNVPTGSAATNIAWSGVTAGMDQYKTANQYVEVRTNVTTLVNWRMLIYTNNTTYTGDKSQGSYGLVGTNTGNGLPLAWRVQESSHTVTPVVNPVFSTTRPAPETEGFTDYMWKFVVDKTQTGAYAWDAADTYVRVWDNTGFFWNEGVGADMDPVAAGAQPCPVDSLDDQVFIYFAAGFHQSLAQTYSTTSLTLEVLLP